MRKEGIDIISTGGETADVGDLVRTIIVDSTVVARMKREDVIDNANINSGDVVVGLSSFGQANYENSYNGGMGSNGLTSARHDVFEKSLALKYFYLSCNLAKYIHIFHCLWNLIFQKPQ